MTTSAKWTLVATSIVTAVGVFSTAPVVANELMDTVRARGNARAGGPTNAHDAWILDRYGALSGTYARSYSGLTKSSSRKLRRSLRKKLRKGY